MRVVVDTNILVSFAIRPSLDFERLFDYLSFHGIILISEETIAELFTVLKRPKFRKYISQDSWQVEIIKDLGSGLNYSKKGLKRLINLITDGKVERLVITHKDRLLRFGSELIFSLCEIFGTEVVIVNRTEDSSFEEDLAQDVLEIITVFSARLYGSRSHKNKKLVEELKDVASRI